MKVVYFSFLFAFHFTLSFSQDLNVTYEVKYLGPTVAEYTKIAREKNYSQQRIKSYPRSYYMIKNAVESQDVVLRTRGDSFELLLSKQLTGANNMYGEIAPSILHLFNYVYSINNQSTIGVDEGKDFAVDFDNGNLKWEIKTEKKLIQGFEVFKATPIYENQHPNRKAYNIQEVWFCPALNRRGGPVMYNNLPGLILEVVNKNSSISATSIEKSKQDKSLFTTEKPIIGEDQYYENSRQMAKAIQTRLKNK